MADEPPLRYVVLRHEGVPDPHFDFMLELSHDQPLATWRCPAWPLSRRVRIIRLADHRREYLTYEGEVSGDRGRVTRVEAGTYRLFRDPQFNSGDRWNWEVRPDGAATGLLLRRWVDTNRSEQWDVAPT